MKNILINIVLPIFMVLLVVGGLGKGCAMLIEFDAKQTQEFRENAVNNPRVTIIDDTTIEIGFHNMVKDEERAAFIRRNNYEVKSSSKDRWGNYVYIVTPRVVKVEE
jgi:hypothetical protein